MPLILPGNVGSATAATGYNVANSLRFHSNTYLNATFGSAPTLATKNTISLWFKRSTLGTLQQLYAANSNAASVVINTNNTIAFYTNSGQLLGPRLYRDTSAWMHFVFAFDSTQGTAANRFKVYINGIEETSFNNTAYPAQDEASQLGANGTTIEIGTRSNHDRIFEGYQAETAFVDGQALAADSFGEFDSDSGIWKPINISGLTFGNNGFYLEYKGTGTSANSSGIGADTSGNDLHFAVTNFAATDQSIDTCTNNFATLNPLLPLHSSTFTEGNLKWTPSTANQYYWANSTFGVSQGKWYMEAKLTTAADHNVVGLSNDAAEDNTSYLSGSGGEGDANIAYQYGYKNSNGQSYNNASGSSYGNTYAEGDIVGMYVDLDNNKIYWSKNGTLQNSGTGVSITDPGSIPGGVYFLAVADGTSSNASVWEVNFGSPPYSISSGNTDDNGYGNFEYSPNITGDSVAKKFYALNTKNLAEYG